MVQTTLKKTQKLSKEQPIIPMVSQEDPDVDVDNIDFIFGDQQ